MQAPIRALSRGRSPAVRDEGPLPCSSWLLPIGIALFAWLYWSLQLAQLEHAPIELPESMRGRLWRVAAFATAGRIVFAGLETAIYCAWWASWGWRLPFVRAFFWMLAVAALDLVAGHLNLIAREHGSPLADWLAILVGPNAARTEASSANRGLWLAFGFCGVLTVTRIVATAAVQASLMRVRLAPVLASVAGLWVGTRLVLWWATDLLSGRSALP